MPTNDNKSCDTVQGIVGVDVLLCRCEGRTWYSTHRGRLWIAATSKEPSPKDVLDTQQFYMDRYGGEEGFVVGSMLLLPSAAHAPSTVKLFGVTIAKVV